MASNSRDDFPERVKRVLQERVGNKCSNPSCRCLTSGPNFDANKPTRVGTAAHITAATLGGPRFDPTLTPEERKSIKNGIWLCRNCGTFVDEDSPNYPIDLLLEWKRRAEELARLELEGKPIPPDLESKGYICTFCGTFVKEGNLVCLGCQAEVAYSSTSQEWEDDFRKGLFIGAALTILLSIQLSSYIPLSSGIGLVCVILIGGATSLYSAYFHARRNDASRKAKPPRFIRDMKL